MQNSFMRFRSGKLILATLLFSLFMTACVKEDNSTYTIVPTNDEDTIASRYYTVTGTLQGAKGEILEAFNSGTDGVVAVLDEKGNVVKAKALGSLVQNLQRWVINNQVRYTYFKTEGNNLLEGVTTTSIGYQYICDSAFNILKKVKLVSNGSVDTDVQDKIDSHDFILLGDDHYILFTYYLKQPSNIPQELNPAAGVTVVDNIIQEIQNDKVIWQWEGSAFPEMYTASIEYNDFTSTSTPQDYMHLNSMYIDPKDNNLICSFRHLNQVMKINRTTGEIIWRLGGTNSDFALTEDQKFLRQHYAHLLSDNKTMILLDNGDATERPYSRVVELELDETNKTITSSTTYKIPDNFIQYTGSVEKNGDTYFIGGGTGLYTLEVNYKTNEVLMRLTHSASSYRAIKYYY